MNRWVPKLSEKWKATPTRWNAACGVGLGASDPPGSETRACTQGFPRNLGGPVPSVRESPPQRRVRYCRAKETKRGGKGGEASEHLIVAEEAGEPTRGTPWREGGAGIWNCWRER
jgi:hypothetical protein